jgi:nitric oxide reductase subunit C
MATEYRNTKLNRMLKLIVFFVLFLSYACYSVIIYSKGTENNIRFPVNTLAKIDKGKKIFQEKNCTACHQLYGLGGYLGPELTTAWSDKNRGEVYIRTFLKYGGPRMPDFHFSKEDTDAITAYLRYVDSTASTYKQPQ